MAASNPRRCARFDRLPVCRRSLIETGHKPSLLTRSKILPRRTYETQVPGDESEPLFGSTGPRAGTDEWQHFRRPAVLQRHGAMALRRRRAAEIEVGKMPTTLTCSLISAFNVPSFHRARGLWGRPAFAEKIGESQSHPTGAPFHRPQAAS